MVTYVHPDFAGVGGAEVLAARQLALLRAAGLPVRLVTEAVDRARWDGALDGVDVRVVGTDGWERRARRALAPVLRRAPRLAAADLERRVRRELSGSAALVATNHPMSAVVGALGDVAPTVWSCNEPPRRLHFADITPTAVARLRAAPPLAPDAHPCAALRWTARHLARYEARLARASFRAERALDRARAREVGRLVAISGYAAELARRVYGRAADAVVFPVVPEGRPARGRTGVDAGALQVLAHSRVEHLKNLDTVVRGFAAFRARRPGAHVLHVVGEGSFLPELRTLAARLALGDAVRFHGFLPHDALAAVYDACDVLAVLPLDEPFGMVFPEAALRGLLVVGPDHGGPAEILDGGALGWTVDPLDPDALAEALAEVAALSHAEADRRRTATADACRARYAPAAVLPLLRAAYRV